jgi:hypothetical protein
MTMTDATIQAWRANVVKRGDAYHAGLSDGAAAAGAGQAQDSCDPPEGPFADNYRTGWTHGYLRTERAARTRARHCEQAQAGYFYCEATPDDPCGPGRHPHDGHNGSCAER